MQMFQITAACKNASMSMHCIQKTILTGLIPVIKLKKSLALTRVDLTEVVLKRIIPKGITPTGLLQSGIPPTRVFLKLIKMFGIIQKIRTGLLRLLILNLMETCVD